MTDNEKMGISQELDFVYITKDGKRFLSYKKARSHQIKILNKGKVCQ